MTKTSTETPSYSDQLADIAAQSQAAWKASLLRCASGLVAEAGPGSSIAQAFGQCVGQEARLRDDLVVMNLQTYAGIAGGMSEALSRAASDAENTLTLLRRQICSEVGDEIAGFAVLPSDRTTMQVTLNDPTRSGH